ncbi:imidazolonepropionase [bacterium]|nr:imidazolonepropionase [bacterium]
MRTVIKNIGKIYTSEGTNYIKGPHQNSMKIHHNVDIEVINSFITKIEPNIAVENSDIIIDAEGKIALPGIIDCHTHPIYGGDRSHEFIKRMNGISYEDITKQGDGINYTLKRTNTAGDLELKENLINNINEFIKYGITSIEAKSGYSLNKAGELRLLKILNSIKENTPIDMKITYLGGHFLPKGRNKNDFINEVLDTLEIVGREKLADYFDVWVEEMAFDLEDAEKMVKKAVDVGLKIRIHSNELSNAHGALLNEKFPIASIDHFDFFDDEQLHILKEHETNITLLPLTQFILGTENYPNARSIIDNNIPVSLATDYNPGTSPSCNSMLLAQISLMKMNMGINEIINAMTINPAVSLGLGEHTGTIERGKWGDIGIYNVDSLEELFYYIGMNKIKYNIKKGKIIYRSEYED